MDNQHISKREEKSSLSREQDAGNLLSVLASALNDAPRYKLSWLLNTERLDLLCPT